jgi:hypothetical protein
MRITSVLGVTLQVDKTWPDGSFECPFCHYAVFAPRDRCDNPSCPASAWATPANRQRFQEAHDRAEAERQRETERRRNHEIAMRRITKEREARDEATRAWYAKVRAFRGCPRCSDQHRDKVVRHRGKCPELKS